MSSSADTTREASSGASESPRRAVLSIGAFIVLGGLCLVSLVVRPIQAMVVFGSGALILAVLAARSQRSSTQRRLSASAALGIVAVLAFYLVSALVNQEPDRVVDHGSLPAIETSSGSA